MAPKRATYNPNFEAKSKTEVSWTRIVRDKFPSGRSCMFCEKPVKHDEIVITLPAKSPAGTLISTNVGHKACFVAFLETVPDQLSVVMNRVNNIKRSFLAD